MYLREINFARPYIVFKDTQVIHVTPRNALIIERRILDLIRRFSRDSFFDDKSLAYILDEYCIIPDPDILAKSCLIKLYDLRAIESTKDIDEDMSLENIYLSDLSLSRVGEDFLDQGLIAGAQYEESIDFTYDVLEDKLSLNSMRSKPRESFAIELFDVSNIEFDENMAKLFLEKYRGKERLPWFTSTSKITEINPENSDTHWDIIKDVIEILPDGRVELKKIKENNNISKNLKTLCYKKLMETLLNDSNNDLEDVESFNYNGFDNILSFANASKVYSSIDDIRKSNFVLVDSDLLEEDFKLNNKIIIYYNSDNFEFFIDEDDKSIRLYIEDSMPIEHSFIIDKDTVLCEAKFMIYNDYGRGDILLRYFHSKANFTEIVASLLNKYQALDDRLILLSFILLNQASFIEHTTKYFKNIKKREEAFEFLSSLKQTALELKLNIDNNVYMNIISNSDIYSSVNSIDSIIEIIFILLRYSLLESDKTLEFIVYIIEKNKIILNNLSEQEKLFIFLKSKNIVYKGKIDKIMRNIYKNSVIEMFQKYMSSTTYRFEEISTIERLINSFANSIDAIERTLKLQSGDIYNNVNPQKLSESILLYYKTLEGKDKLLNNINNIDKNINELCTKLGLKKYVLREEGIYNNILEDIKKTIYTLNDSSINNFKTVYVFDTNTLMNNSEAVRYINKDSLLVIPTVVVEELDKLKTDKDKSNIAQQAIKAINSVKAKVNTRIVDYKENNLISKSLDKNNNDNKILATAMSFIIKDLYLVTNDINLKNKASSQKIKSLSLDEFITKNKNQKN